MRNWAKSLFNCTLILTALYFVQKNPWLLSKSDMNCHSEKNSHHIRLYHAGVSLSFRSQIKCPSAVRHIPGSKLLHAAPSNERKAFMDAWFWPYVPVHFPFWIHSVQLLSVLNPKSHTSQWLPAHPSRHLSHCPTGPKFVAHSVQLPPVHPCAQMSQFSPPHPFTHLSHCPTGPKFPVHSVQFFPVHPLKHWSHCPGGPKCGAHASQFLPDHPVRHFTDVSFL